MSPLDHATSSSYNYLHHRHSHIDTRKRAFSSSSSRQHQGCTSPMCPSPRTRSPVRPHMMASPPASHVLTHARGARSSSEHKVSLTVPPAPKVGEILCPTWTQMDWEDVAMDQPAESSSSRITQNANEQLFAHFHHHGETEEKLEFYYLQVAEDIVKFDQAVVDKLRQLAAPTLPRASASSSSSSSSAAHTKLHSVRNPCPPPGCACCHCLKCAQAGVPTHQLDKCRNEPEQKKTPSSPSKKRGLSNESTPLKNQKKLYHEKVENVRLGGTPEVDHKTSSARLPFSPLSAQKANHHRLQPARMPRLSVDQETLKPKNSARVSTQAKRNSGGGKWPDSYGMQLRGKHRMCPY